jgi:hypothetical protein
MAAIVKGRLGGGTIDTKPYTVGIGGVTKGDLLVDSAGTLIVATGGDNAAPILGVAVETASAAASSLYVPLLPDVLMSIPVASGDTLYNLDTCGLDATTLELSDDEAVAYHRVRIVETDPSDSTRRNCVSTGWLLNATA